MPVTAKWFGRAGEGMVGGTAARRFDWVADTIKVGLTTATFTPDQDVHDFWNDVTNEVSGTGYTAGGQALSGKSVTYTGATNIIAFLAADTVWTAATFTARYAIVYKDTGTASTSPLLGYVDFGADQTVNGANFTIDWDATEGVLKMTAA